MKSKLYLFSMWTSIFCTSTAYGDTCPDLQNWKTGDSLPNGWEVLNWIGMPIPGQDLVFKSAWLRQGKGAECDYAQKGNSLETKLLLQNNRIKYDSDPYTWSYSFKGGGTVTYSYDQAMGEEETEECKGPHIHECIYELRPPLEPPPPAPEPAPPMEMLKPAS